MIAPHLNSLVRERNLVLGALLALAVASWAILIWQSRTSTGMGLTMGTTPLAFVLSSWRDGYRGAVHMGLQHGLYCLGCCWFLFVILFPLGMMNIALLAVLTLVIFVEKALPYGDRMSWVAAAALVAYGLAVMIIPELLPTMAPAHDNMPM
jgi:predicted metal-binding membrane protein